MQDSGDPSGGNLPSPRVRVGAAEKQALDFAAEPTDTFGKRQTKGVCSGLLVAAGGRALTLQVFGLEGGSLVYGELTLSAG